MTLNRLIDHRLDALNPRTRSRALPVGQLSLPFAAGFTVVSCALLALAAYQLNPLAFKLSPVAIAILLGYSFTKRFTWASHFFLGAALGLTPVAGWIAVRGDVLTHVDLLQRVVGHGEAVNGALSAAAIAKPSCVSLCACTSSTG